MQFATCYNVEESCKHYAKYKKLITKDHILYDSTHEISRIKKPIEREGRLMAAYGWGAWA